MFFFKNYAENDAGRLVSDLFLFFKLNMSWKQVFCSLVSIYFNSPQLAYNKNKLYKNLDYWSRDNGWKGSGTSFSTIIYVWFFRKNVSCYILSTGQISLFDCLYFWKYWATCVCFNCLLIRLLRQKIWN